MSVSHNVLRGLNVNNRNNAKKREMAKPLLYYCAATLQSGRRDDSILTGDQGL